MPNQFIKSLLSRLQEPENMIRFNTTSKSGVDVEKDKLSNRLIITFATAEKAYFEQCYEVYQLYIIRIALKVIPYYRKSTKGWILFDREFPSIEKQKTARLLYPKYPESLCEAYLHALNQHDWMAACEKVWMENEQVTTTKLTK